jgi:FMNH2-dependent dimethyl sulfone monooxygenase
MKLGVFGLNAASGIAMTKVPERWAARWDDVQDVVVAAEELGFDFILPLARWCGYGGETDPTGSCYETLTFSAALSGLTDRIRLFSTIHVPFVPPAFAARAAATVDAASHGRFGLNLVCGWSLDEFRLFGIESDQLATRYEQGHEWVEVFERMLLDQPFERYDGKFYSLRNAECRPMTQQRPRPPLISAAFSPAGREFAVRNCDILFIMHSDLERSSNQIASAKDAALSLGREIEIYSIAHVVCRDTDQEAEEYYDHYAMEMADEEAVENFVRNMAPSAPLVSKLLQANGKKIAGGAGSAPVIGSPDTVARKIVEIEKAGFDGLALGFVDYAREVPEFGKRVLPRLTVQRGGP